MNAFKRTLVVVLVLMAACSTGTTTDGIDMSQLEDLQSDLTEFASEVETAAPASIQTAWDNLESTFTGLMASGADLELSADDLAPLREAADEVTEAVDIDGTELSAEFREFWGTFADRIEALTP